MDKKATSLRRVSYHNLYFINTPRDREIILITFLRSASILLLIDVNSAALFLNYALFGYSY